MNTRRQADSSPLMNTCKNLIIALALLPLWAFAQAPVVEILQTDPVPGTALHANEPLYVHLKYRSNEPLRFQVMGFLDGEKMEKSAAFNPAPEYPAGDGKAIAWIAYSGKTGLDELKVIVSDRHWKTVDKISLPLEMNWSGRPSKHWRQPAEWARTLSAQQQEMTRQTMGGTPPSAGETALWGILMMLMAWSIPGYIALQIYMLLKYEGRWRRLAALPLWGTVPLFAYTLFALLAGSNLWPLMLLFLGPCAFIYLLIILWLKKKE